MRFPVSSSISYLFAAAFMLVTAVAYAGGSTEVFFGAKFEPPAGRALHGWGQISHGWNTDHPGAAGDMQDYLDYVAAVGDYPPAVVSFYIHPQREDGQAQLDGFIERYRAFAKTGGWQIAQIAYDFDPDATLAGRADQQLEQFFNAVRDVGKPVLLRIGWEFNNRGHFDPRAYREGYRYIVDKMRSMDISNVATLWHASVPDLNELTGMQVLSEHPYMDFYPGDDYVDWWSISNFDPRGFRSPGTLEFYENAASRSKPVFIGESAPWFGEPGKLMHFRDPVSVEESMSWFDDYFSLFEEFPHIKGMNVIIIDWQRWNWIWPHIPGGFNNTRLDLFPELPAQYQRRLQSPRFIHAHETQRIVPIHQ